MFILKLTATKHMQNTIWYLQGHMVISDNPNANPNPRTWS